MLLIDSSADKDNDGLTSQILIPQNPILFSQKHLNDFRDLWLSKKKAGLLGSKLKERNMVEKDVTLNHVFITAPTMLSCYAYEIKPN